MKQKLKMFLTAMLALLILVSVRRSDGNTAGASPLRLSSDSLVLPE